MLQVVAGDRAGLLRIDVHGGYADHLTRLDAGIRLDATTIDTHLTGAQKFLQRTEAETRIVDLEPAVEPHARLIGFHGDMFDACHQGILSCSGSPPTCPVPLVDFRRKGKAEMQVRASEEAAA
jgi:hypothetical protein